MAGCNYKGFLKKEIERLEIKLQTETDKGRIYNIKREIDLLRRRVQKDVRMGCFGSDV